MMPKTTTSRILLALFGATAIAVIVVACGGGGSEVSSPTEKPLASSNSAITGVSVTWSPDSINQSIKPGETKAVSLTLTANRNTPSAVLRVVPEIAPYVTAAPATIGPLAAGQSVQVTLSFAATVNALPVTATGTVQLRTADASGSTLAQPLPVSIRILPRNAYLNAVGQYFFIVPVGWSVSRAAATSDATTLLPPGKSPDASHEYVGDILIESTINPSNLTLSAYYASPGVENLYLSSVQQTSFTVNGLDAVRFDGVAGMVSSTIVAIKLNGRIIEIIDYVGHETDGILDTVVSGFTDTL